MTDTERAIARYQRIESERDLTVTEETILIGLLRCAAEDREEVASAPPEADPSKASNHPTHPQAEIGPETGAEGETQTILRGEKE